MEKLNIVITGRRNVGKSSLINAILQDNKAIVSPLAGTTTDPVKKTFEIPNHSTAVLIDTAGIDDVGEIGKQRIEKTFHAIESADIALLLVANNTFGNYEMRLIELFKQLNIPYFVVYTHKDIVPLNDKFRNLILQEYNGDIIEIDTRNVEPNVLIDAIKKIIPQQTQKHLLDDIISTRDLVLLVTPIDSEAPTGRLILPQVQTLRNLLDNHAISIIIQLEELNWFLKNTTIKPSLVITDSQAFHEVAELITPDIALTSFSILFARLKGDFDYYKESIEAIQQLLDGDRILILESCSHHSSCDDIGRVKIPRLLEKYTGKKLIFEIIPALGQLPQNLEKYSFAIQCGGCMITTKQLQRRLNKLMNAGIPVSNYGMVLSYVNGIFERAIQPFYKKIISYKER